VYLPDLRIRDALIALRAVIRGVGLKKLLPSEANSIGSNAGALSSARRNVP